MSDFFKDRQIIDGLNVSPPKVMQSAAGFYVGRSYLDSDAGLEFPYSRDSFSYFNTYEEANAYLISWEKSEKA